MRTARVALLMHVCATSVVRVAASRAGTATATFVIAIVTATTAIVTRLNLTPRISIDLPLEQ